MVRRLALVVILGCSVHRSEPEAPRPLPALARVAPPAEPPWTLTSSDGAGLELVRVDARAVVEGPLALTELHLYFHNGEDRVREGRFAITLPARAAVSRFAMQIDDRLQEAEVVPKALGRRAYEDFLHHKQDPALLEKATGNEFTARVFPIPALADKHLVISFSQELGGGYVLPLRGLPAISQIDVRVDAMQDDGSHQVRELHESGWRPDRDFTAEVAGVSSVGAGGLIAVRLSRVATAAEADPPTAITLAVDTSASRALGFASYIDAVAELVGAMQARYGDLALHVVAFDQDVEAIYDGPASGFAAARTALLDRGAAGASDLGQALARVSNRRVVVVTDGVVTAGTADLAAARRADRIDVVLAGGIRDQQLARSLARAGKRAGDVLDLDRGAQVVALGLGERVRVDVPIAIAGASWVFPRGLPALRASSDPAIVYARVSPGATTVDVTIGADHRSLAIAPATPAMIGRAFAGAQIAELEQRFAASHDDAVRGEIERRSVAARVVSSQTAMLVLERESDYDRFGIARTSLSDILVVGEHGIEQSHRTFVASAAEGSAEPSEIQFDGVPGRPQTDGRHDADPQLSRQQAIDNAREAGLLGSSGEGRGNFGTGRAGFGPGGGTANTRPRTATVPTVTIAQPVVTSSLDRTYIRRYIKRYTANITYCYERELPRRPTLAGDIAIQFLIDPTGHVQQATASGFDATVANCIAGVIRRIEFPANGSTAIVNYPFTFRVAGTLQPLTPAPAPVVQAAEPVKPLSGKLAEVMGAIADNSIARALTLAHRWHAEAPGDVLALIALGEALEANRQPARAARIYGSIIDLFPSRADLRRFAGERLERIGLPSARRLAVDTYRRAVADRPDHLTGHRLLAHALLRSGEPAGAFSAILAAVDRGDGPPGGDRIVREDAGIIASAYLARGGPRRAIEAELAKRSIAVAARASTRFILYWETDANDVDFHIHDRHDTEAYYAAPALPSGGSLYADVTTGYGPECFAIPGTPTAGPYRLSLHYYARGPMGYGMGLLQVERFDGKGNVTFEDRPYVIMADHAFIDLGTVP